jgi:hypothetical protein
MEVDFCKSWRKINTGNGGCLTTYSVYEFVAKLEDILIGPHESPEHESGTNMHKVANVPHRLRDDPDVDWFAATMAAAKGAVALSKNAFEHLPGSHKIQWKKEIVKMFDEAQVLIQNRQETRADEMIKWRNTEVEKRKKALQDRKETG